MSEIHYFQRYSQKENVVTNNTLLLLSRLYHYNPLWFQSFLSDLMSGFSNLSVGVKFAQQIRSKNSIPDGFIEQQSFKIVVETKLYGNPRMSQLEKHLDAFADQCVQTQVLLLIDKEMPGHDVIADVNDRIKQTGKSVIFVPKTFEEIIEVYRSVLRKEDYEMHEIVDDFEGFCAESGLLRTDQYRMRVVAAGATLKENLTFNIYYDPASNGYQKHKYIGLYDAKQVKAIGQIENIVTAQYDFNTKKLDILDSDEPVTSGQIQRIKDTIENAKTTRNWNLSRNHKFFLLESFESTTFKKRTKYPIKSKKYIDLKGHFEGPLPRVADLAVALCNKEWD